MGRRRGNVTGIVFFLGFVLEAKRLELLGQSSKTRAKTVEHNARQPECSFNTQAERREGRAGRSVGRRTATPTSSEVSSVGDIEAAFATLVQRGAGALFVGSGAFLNSHSATPCRRACGAPCGAHDLPTARIRRGRRPY